LRLLAFDTASAAISAVAARDEVIVAARGEPLARGHAERILPLLQEILASAGWTWREVELVAVTVGPGNFTGLRAGIAVARALSLALDCPTLGIGTLEVVAEAAAAAESVNELPIQVVVDAKRGQVYAQCFAPDLEPWAGPALLPIAEVANSMPVRCLMAGDGAIRLSVLTERDDRIVRADTDARCLARATLRRLAGGALPAPGSVLRPLYLRPPDARLGAGTSLLAAQA
jgi:tRNA threonylcarbamoyladenosine biosynthesis protein TsaB